MPLLRPKKPKIDMDQFLKDVAKWGVSLGIGSAVAGGVGAGVTKGLEVVEDKVTRSRNQKKILRMAPELAEVPKERFDAMYDSLRRAGHASDTLLAAEAMKRMKEMPESVVGLIPDLLKAKKGRGAGTPGGFSGAFAEAAKKPMIGDLEPINVPS